MKNANADKDMLKEMIDMIDRECKKTYQEQNHELIKELTSAVFDATSSKDTVSIRQEGIEKLLACSSNQTKKLKKRTFTRFAVPISACIILFIGMNVWTLHVWGMNAFELLYNIIPDGITFHPNDLENSQEISLDTTIDDPYGIKEKCEEYGFSPLTPSYIPEDLKLLNLSEHDGTDVKSLSFIYQNEKRSVSLNYDAVKNQDMYNDATIGFPSDEYNIHTETIGDIKVIISWEDHIFRAEFCDNQIVYDISCKNLEYDTAYHILVSYFI